MFESIFTVSAGKDIAAGDVFLSLGIAVLSGIIFSTMCFFKTRSTKSFFLATVILPAVVALVIILVNGNIGAGVAIMPTGGMTSEATNGNASGITKNTSVSLSSGGYLTVSVNSVAVVTVKMPCAMTGYVIYLGSSSATVSSSSSSSVALDANGVCWN